MNYEQKYNEALERARKELQEFVHKDCDDMTRRTAITIIHNLFPELKESEDDKIRKAIHIYLDWLDGRKDYAPKGIYSIKDMIAWLKKQKPIDEEELKKDALKYVARQFMKWLDASIQEDEMCLSNAECKVIEDAFLKDDWARISHYMCEKLKRQGEQIEVKKVEQGNHPRIVMADFNGGEGFFKLNLDNLNKEQVDAIEMMINNPKQDKQTQLDYEHADIPKKDFAPIEPKFKVGDWVVTNYGRVSHVVSVDKYGDGYTLDDGVYFSGSWCDMYRLWTIQDAKDGDVLVAKDGHPFIFTGEFDAQDDNPTAYCGINSNNKFITGKGSHWTFKDGIKPATKEQRDFLFQKIKEAGYEWDADEKEVKEIEP